MQVFYQPTILTIGMELSAVTNQNEAPSFYVYAYALRLVLPHRVLQVGCRFAGKVLSGFGTQNLRFISLRVSAVPLRRGSSV